MSIVLCIIGLISCGSIGGLLGRYWLGNYIDVSPDGYMPLHNDDDPTKPFLDGDEEQSSRLDEQHSKLADNHSHFPAFIPPFIRAAEMEPVSDEEDNC